MKILRLLIILVLAQFAKNAFGAEAVINYSQNPEYTLTVMSEEETKQFILLETLNFIKKSKITILNAKKVKQNLRKIANKYGYNSLSDSELYNELIKEMIVEEIYKQASGLPVSHLDKERNLIELIKKFMTLYKYSGSQEDITYIHNEFIKRQKVRLNILANLDPEKVKIIDSVYSQLYPEDAENSEFRLQATENAKKKCANPDCKKIYEIKDLKKCSGCNITSYCSLDCQKADWKRHKLNCQKYKAHFLTAKKIKPESQKPVEGQDKDKDSDGKEKDKDVEVLASSAGAGSASVSVSSASSVGAGSAASETPFHPEELD